MDKVRSSAGDRKVRCKWAEGGDELMRRYHDEDWGVPERGERKLFEFLVLEGAQAGLSWATILKKREAYRRAFGGWDAEKVARFEKKKVRELMKDAGIVRNRMKIEATIANARAVLAVRREHGSLARFLWGFVDGKPKQNAWRRGQKVPAKTAESQAMSKALRAAGFRFVGPTICYAFMQAMGMVNDHARECWRWKEVRKSR